MSSKAKMTICHSESVNPNTFTYQDFKNKVIHEQQERILFEGNKRDLLGVMPSIYKWARGKCNVLIVDIIDGFMELKFTGKDNG